MGLTENINEGSKNILKATGRILLVGIMIAVTADVFGIINL